ncbi:MAG: hypothetical protein JNK82_42945 [Myxococcaceae bacterium]|nr:hypothetical protein [Myxococcaceae bacterium]
MKFLCSSCNRLLDVERFRVEGAVLIISCPGCGAENRAIGNTPAAPPAANVTPLRPPAPPVAPVLVAPPDGDRAFDVPPGHCPKCISRRSAQALACPNCGLVFEQADGDAFAPSEWLKNEWLLLLQTWGDEARHEQLRSEAMSRNELAEAGRLYRLRLALQPQDPIAARGRDEVLRLAVLPSLNLQRTKPGDGETPRWKYVALSVVIVACLIAIYVVVGQMLQS